MKRRTLVAALLALSTAGCGRTAAVDAGGGQADLDAGQSDTAAALLDVDAGYVDDGEVEACDAGTACVYSCEAGPPDVDGACGNFSRGFIPGPGCTDSVKGSHEVGCSVWLPSCLPPADWGPGCVCQTVPQSQEPDAIMITGWGCPL